MEILCNTVRCQDPEFRAVYIYSISETIIIIINKILRNHKKYPLGIFTPMMLIIIPIVSNNEVRVCK